MIEPVEIKIVIAGSRTLTPNVDDIDRALEEFAIAWRPFIVVSLVSGRAPGADRAGEAWARARGVPIKPYPAEWHLYGNGAGHRRNTTMSIAGDALLAFWNGHSPGTRDMIRKMQAAGKPHYVKRVDDRI